MPPTGDIVDLVVGTSDLSTLLAQVQDVGLASALKGMSVVYNECGRFIDWKSSLIALKYEGFKNWYSNLGGGLKDSYFSSYANAVANWPFRRLVSPYVHCVHTSIIVFTFF